jgi:ATP-binding protein involved in chromosome partitioning
MAMPTEQQISEVLGQIQDPELHRGLNDLNMVRGITIEGPNVTTLIALTIPGCPLKDYFHTVIPAKIKEAFPAVEHVAVELTSMTEEERQNLLGGLRKDTPAPFARTDSPLAFWTRTCGVSRSRACSTCANGRLLSAT